MGGIGPVAADSGVIGAGDDVSTGGSTAGPVAWASAIGGGAGAVAGAAANPDIDNAGDAVAALTAPADKPADTANRPKPPINERTLTMLIFAFILSTSTLLRGSFTERRSFWTADRYTDCPNPRRRFALTRLPQQPDPLRRATPRSHLRVQP